MEDSQIMALYCAQDERAVTESENRYGRACFQLALYILESTQEAAACVQAAYRHAREDIPFSRPTHLGAYLYKLTRRIALDRYHANHAVKRGAHLFHVTLDEGSECFPAAFAAYSFDNEADAERLGARISHFLRRQRLAVRNLFISRYFYAEPTEEIARRFGLSDRQVNTILRRTRQRLCRFMESESRQAYPSGHTAPTDALFAQSMSTVEDALVVAAHAPRAKWRRWLPVAVAVCLVAAFLAAYPYLRTVIDTNSDLIDELEGDAVEENGQPGRPVPERYIGVGKPTTLGGTTMTLTSATDTTATFTVVKTDSEPLYLALYDMQGLILASTEPDFRVDGAIIRPYTIRLAVDNTEAILYTCPTAPDTYEITVDFSTPLNGSYPMMSIIGAYAYVGEDGAAVSRWFVLPAEADSLIPETTETTDPADEST